MKPGTRVGGDVMKPGTRVQVPVWSDAWMMGDRFGEVVKTERGFVFVLMDKSSRVKRFTEGTVEEVK